MPYNVRVRNGILLEAALRTVRVVRTRKPEIVDISELPPIKMEKEMGRLLGISPIALPDSQRSVIQFVGITEKGRDIDYPAGIRHIFVDAYE